MNAIIDSASARELVVQPVGGEPRILDTDLAERLGFGKPSNIRSLIRRHADSLAAFGTVCAVKTVRRGQKAEEFYLNRRQAIFVTAKSETHAATDITIEVIERFDAYERGAHPASAPTFNVRDRGHLLALSVELTRELEAAQAEVAVLAPKAAALDLLGGKVGSESLSNVGKELAFHPLSRFFDWARDHRWIFKRSGRWVAFQDKIAAGLLEHVEKPKDTDPDQTWTQCVVTPKGRAGLAELLERERRPLTVA
jgi:phage antirepressor YoqD-like protein